MSKLSLRKVSIVVLAGALALGGCKKSGVDVKNASPGEVVKQMANSDLKPMPGRWESTMKMEAMDMPDMPPEAKAMMQKSAGIERHMATCLTPEQAAKPAADFFNQRKSDCTFDHFTMAGGKVDGTMTCNHGPEKMTLTMSGQYGRESYEVHTTSKVEIPGGKPMTSSMTMISHRTGECKGDELGAKPHG